MLTNSPSKTRDHQEEETMMLISEEAALAGRALDEIDDLLNNYDDWTQIRIMLPLLHRHRKTLVKLQHAYSRPTRAIPSEPVDDRWVDDLVATYKQLGGQAEHSVVYRNMRELRQAAGRSWPSHAEEAIRQTLQAYCADAQRYRGGPNLFHMLRRGVWGLRET
jgi:hypothetical protein